MKNIFKLLQHSMFNEKSRTSSTAWVFNHINCYKDIRIFALSMKRYKSEMFQILIHEKIISNNVFKAISHLLTGKILINIETEGTKLFYYFH